VAPTRSARAVPSAALVAELDRLLSDVLHSVDEVLRWPHPPPESLHSLHRDMRRLGAGLDLWRRLLASRDRELLRPLDARVRRLSRLVGRVRDRDIAIALLERVDGKPYSRGEARRLEQYRTRLRDDARTGRELLRAFLRAERDAHLFDRVQDSFHVRPAARRVTELPKLIARSHLRNRARLEDAHRKARRRPSPSRLHHLRIRVRGVRHLSEISKKVVPTVVPEFSTALRKLQGDLGRLHDLDVVLDGLDREIRSTAWAEALRKKRRRQRRRIAERLREEPIPPEPVGGPPRPKGRQGHRPRAS
jgi:CHAD domain-containing protein